MKLSWLSCCDYHHKLPFVHIIQKKEKKKKKRKNENNRLKVCDNIYKGSLKSENWRIFTYPKKYMQTLSWTIKSCSWHWQIPAPRTSDSLNKIVQKNPKAIGDQIFGQTFSTVPKSVLSIFRWDFATTFASLLKGKSRYIHFVTFSVGF